jgi:hypothetical protein
MKKQKEETVSLAKYLCDQDGMRMSWSNDVKKMMKLWDSHERLINLLENIAKDTSVSQNIRDKIVSTIERARTVKI